MTFLDRTLGTGDKPLWFVVEREPYGNTGSARVSRDSALWAFTSRLTGAAWDGEGYSPWDGTRRLMVTCLAPVAVLAPGDDAEPYTPDDEPLPAAEDRLREVLGDDYDLIVHGPRVASLLES
ncbi:hypothetical protein ACQP1P_38860 [Dactylosporangium sp. CA-052675]|uniref:hypothetical protein n=1 Tax=Dactylosporangium sp. CA-052675 TaxID=3239927 RepID=UPI003D92FD8B